MSTPVYGIPAAVGIAVLVPIAFFLAIAVIIVAVLYFRHRERMAYLSRSPYPPPGAADDTMTQPPPPPYGDAYRYPPYRDRFHPALYHPLARIGRLIGWGVGITLGLVLPFGLSPLLLIGLIPLFIGLIRLGELYVAPAPPPAPSSADAALWLQRSLWSGGIGLALILGLLTLGPTPLLLAGTIPFGYGLGLLLAHYLARQVR